jgi:hypothetical protein
MRKLPIGMTDFANIREGGYYYADKTESLYELADWGPPRLLSRPKGFGKTTLLSAFEYLLKGRRELFKGLWIDSSNYDWEPYQVVKLEVGKIVSHDPKDIKKDLIDLIRPIAQREKVEIKYDLGSFWALKSLIRQLYKKTGQRVAVLVDDYDFPILNNLDDPGQTAQILDTLIDCYRALKTSDSDEGPVILTGSGRFCLATFFGGLNNLIDITVHDEFVASCGLTEAEVEDLLSEREEELLKRLKDKGFLTAKSDGQALRKFVRDWYGGYSWDGETRLYHPRATLKLLNEAELDVADFSIQAPPQVIKREEDPWSALEYLHCPPKMLWGDGFIFDIARAKPKFWLFQSGHLSFEERRADGFSGYPMYTPNLAVRSALLPLVLTNKPLKDPIPAAFAARRLVEGLFSLDAAGLAQAFSQFLGFFPEALKEDNGRYFISFFHAALLIAGKSYDHLGSTPGGGYQVGLTGPNGQGYNVLISLHEEKLTAPASFNPPTTAKAIDRLKRFLDQAARQVLERLNQTTATELSEEPRVKVAMVVARSSLVGARFAEAQGINS